MSLKSLLQPFLIWSMVLISTGCNVTNESQQKTTVSSEKAKSELSESAKDNKFEHNQTSDQDVPEKVIKVLAYVREHGRSPQGYAGGRKFGNFEKRLPLKDSNARPMKYQEWDVNPKKKGKNRGAERLITSENRRAWYTRDHYDSFVEIR